MGDAVRNGVAAAAGVGATSAVVQSVAPDWTPVLNAVILACASLIPLIVLFIQAEIRSRLHSLEAAPVATVPVTVTPVVTTAAPAPVVTAPTVEDLLAQVLAQLQSSKEGK